MYVIFLQVCGKTFKLKTHVTMHMIQHEPAVVYPCDTCGKEFPDRQALKKHRLVHSVDKEYACNFPGCKEVFTQKVKYDSDDSYILVYTIVHRLF